MNGAPDQSAGHSPVRPKDSVRRTSTIDTSWPEGQFGPMKMIGRARDVYHKNDLNQIPTKARKVYDVSGAGDTVIATFAINDICGTIVCSIVHC